MLFFFPSEKSLSSEEIFNLLKKVRHYSVAPYSNYHAAAITEVQLNKNLYFYTSGVNIENDEHNRLSIHSEQNAIANTVTLLGGNIKFKKIWIMAAPANVILDEKQKAGKSCGHCRQIMLSFAEKNAEIYVVTLDGRFSSPDSFEKNFLPDGFSNQDLNLSSTEMFNSPTLQIYKFISESHHLPIEQIAKYLQILTPHIISNNFQTSSITACIMKCHNGRYAAGVLVQDIAFLTTDAIFAALGNAITQFGNKNLQFDEIHFASTALHPAQMTLGEIETLYPRYVHEKTVVYFHTVNNQHACYSFYECVRARLCAVT